MLKSTYKISSETLRGVVIAIFVIKMLFGANLVSFWNMLSSLQLLTHFMLLSIPYPSIALTCFQAILDISNADIIDKVTLHTWFSFVLSNTVLPDY